MTSKHYRIAAIPGDGIGTEVITAGVEALEVLAEMDGRFGVSFEHFDWGSDRYKREGSLMPADGADQLRAFDAILFGAVGAPDVPDHLTLWGLRLAICQPLDQYANVRPTRVLPGITSPLRHVQDRELDWVIVRENSEGEYVNQGGRFRRGLPGETAIQTAVHTRRGIERILKYGFERARTRRNRLTMITKSNVRCCPPTVTVPSGSTAATSEPASISIDSARVALNRVSNKEPR